MKKLIAVLLLSFGSIIPLSAQGKWEWITPYPVGNYPGYSCQSEGRVFYLGWPKTFFYTSDGGNSFQINSPYRPITDTQGFNNIAFADSLHGIILDDEGIFNTTDGGKSWLRPMPLGYFSLAAFGSHSVGWVYGTSGLNKTTNSGVSWFEINSNLFDIRGVPGCIYALDKDSLWICKNFNYNEGGAICFSSNGGYSWVKQNSIVSDSNYQVNYNAIKINSSGVGLAVGQILILDANPHYISFMVRTTDFGNTWQRVPLDTSLFLKVILNTDEDEWIVLGNNNLFSPSDSSPMRLKSSDAGITWDYKFDIFNTYYNNTVNTAEYVKEDNIILASGYDGIYRSFDRGDSFKRLSNKNEIRAWGFALDKSTASDNQLAVVVSDGDSLIVSEDGGRSWQKKFATHIGAFNGNVAAAEGVIFAGTNGGLYKSADLGDTWTNINSDYYGGRGLTAYDKDNIAFYTYTRNSTILKYTTNGGDDWSSTPFFSFSRDIQLAEGSRVFACGSYYDTITSNSGYIFTSPDFGHNWNVIDTRYEVKKIRAVNRNIALAISKYDLYRSTDSGGSWIVTKSSNDYFKFFGNFAFKDTLNGTMQISYQLFNTNNAGLSWSVSNLSLPLWGGVEYMEYNNRGDLIVMNGLMICIYRNDAYSPGEKNSSGANIPLEFSLEQNYPNPFNSATQISWQSPVSGQQSLKVYDVLGRQVAVLFDGSRPAGKYKAVFNASNLASGIYIYRLEAGEYTAAKKMILLK